MFVANDGFGDPADSHSNTIIGSSLAVDDFIGTVTDRMVNSVHGLFMVVMSPKFAEVVDADAGDIGTAPDGKFTVAVFADNISMDTAAVYGEMFA